MFDVSPFGLDRSLQIQAAGPRRHRGPMRGLPPRFFCGRLAICGPGIPTSINSSVYDPGSLAPGRWAISPLPLVSVSWRRHKHGQDVLIPGSPSRRSFGFSCFCSSTSFNSSSSHTDHSFFHGSAWGCHSFQHKLLTIVDRSFNPTKNPLSAPSLTSSEYHIKIKMAAKITLALIASATLVAGHGYVTNATIGGTEYEFYQPYQDPYKTPAPERVSRKITGNGPVEDVTSAAIQCGADTAPAALVAEAAAGSDVELFWTLWPESHIGPSITYMAKCEGDCTSYEPGTDAVWFKIQEKGREGTSDTWGSTPVMTAGGSISYTIPECLEPGNYLVRHELIALHSAASYPGAQFYPGCHQIKVTGGGSTAPTDLVAFPGAYKGTDAGIAYNAYTSSEYTVPGPALFTCSGSSSGSAGSAGSAASSAAAPSSTLATVTKASTAAPVATDAADDDEACDVPATTTAASTSSVAANVAAAATSDASDDEACDAEETVTATITSAAAPAETGAADDECPAEEEPPVEETGDDECEA
ncbi:hypothetical protein KVR01_004338 [Diaporthe batatas]|uniref:uncharacterized protein n=1 Tax=Diaporthe batatas TaxID=748121 RepID=UPI001D0582D5|nr:uncharacterized protein KVR01_004338 [Diaporthe batatas]KAG8165786.1 hypothetical protein KVR01_004338 [Diaporthe batatas]